MSLVGTRPPTVDEWELYEPHHRAKGLGAKLWENDSHTLWSAALYPEKDTIEEAVKAALNLYAIVKGEDQADLSAWREAQKKSLCSGFNDADPDLQDGCGK